MSEHKETICSEKKSLRVVVEMEGLVAWLRSAEWSPWVGVDESRVPYSGRWAKILRKNCE